MPREPKPVSRAIRKLLNEARVARLATVDEKSRPHAVPVCFVYDGKVLYSAIDQKPKRIPPARLQRLQNIRAVPEVVLLLDEYAEDWSRLWYVLIRGKAKLVAPSQRLERTHAIGRLRAKYPQYDQSMLPDDAPIIRITPERITSWGRIG